MRAMRSPRTERGGMVELPTLGGHDSEAAAVNAGGQVVGESITAANSFHAFSWTETGGMIDLGTLGGTSSFAVAVNAGGQVVGASTTVGDAHCMPRSGRDAGAPASVSHGLEEGSAPRLAPLALGNRLSSPSGPRASGPRKRRTDVPLQAPADGRLTSRPAHPTGARRSTGGRATRSRSTPNGRCASSASATTTPTSPRCWL